MQRFMIFIVNIMCLTFLAGCRASESSVVQDTSTAEILEVASEEESFSGLSSEGEIAVYVCGAVSSPGVYYLPYGAIKEDALNLAGGFLDGAATTYVNLAEPVEEGEQIYFPYMEELGEDYSPLNLERTDGKININKADKEELMSLPGIGENKAEAIIKYREKNGAFQSIEEITNIPGIKEGVYNNIRDYIVVE